MIDGYELDYRQISEYQSNYISYVYQFYNLVESLTVQENIVLLAKIKGRSFSLDKLYQFSDKLEITPLLKKFPRELSGGQKQRVSLVRAFLCNTPILLADEPTGALDSKSSKDLLECLKMVNDQEKATILMVTHDAFSASYAKDVYILSDGMIKCKLTKGNDRKEFYDRIIDMQTSMGSDFS